MTSTPWFTVVVLRCRCGLQFGTRRAVSDEADFGTWATLWQPETLCYPPASTVPVTASPCRGNRVAESAIKGREHQSRPAHQPDDPSPPGPGRRRRRSTAWGHG